MVSSRILLVRRMASRAPCLTILLYSSLLKEMPVKGATPAHKGDAWPVVSVNSGQPQPRWPGL